MFMQTSKCKSSSSYVLTCAYGTVGVSPLTNARLYEESPWIIARMYGATLKINTETGEYFARSSRWVTIYWEGQIYTTSKRVHTVPSDAFSPGVRLPDDEKLWNLLRHATVSRIPCIPCAVIVDGIAGELLWRILEGTHVRRYEGELTHAGKCAEADGFSVVFTGEGAESLFRGSEFDLQWKAISNCRSPEIAAIDSGDTPARTFAIGGIGDPTIANWTRTLDVRAPFTDSALVEYADSISPAFKLDGTRPMGLLWDLHENSGRMQQMWGTEL